MESLLKQSSLFFLEDVPRYASTHTKQGDAFFLVIKKVLERSRRESMINVWGVASREHDQARQNPSLETKNQSNL